MMPGMLRWRSGIWIALCGGARAATFLVMTARSHGVAHSRDTQLMRNPLIRMAAITITITILIAVTYFLTHYHH